MTPMTNLIALLGAALFCASTAAVAQEPTPPQRRSEPAEAKTEADARSIEQLIEALGAETPSERREAERLLQERGEGAKDALEKAVDDHEDPEVRWRARRVLRALNGNAPRLERAGEGVERTAPRAPRAEGGEPSPARGMEDLERRMEEMREQLETMRLGLPGFEAIPFRGLGTGAWNLGTKVEVSPGRVRVELQEPKEGGGTETKVYEADDLDSFRREHPEIAQRVFGGAAPGLPGSFRWFDSNGRLPLDLPQLRGWRDGQAAPWIVSPQGQDGLEVPSEPPAAGERLGIYVGALDGAVRRFLGIEGDDGILVESIEPDSFCAQAQLPAARAERSAPRWRRTVTLRPPRSQRVGERVDARSSTGRRRRRPGDLDRPGSTGSGSPCTASRRATATRCAASRGRSLTPSSSTTSKVTSRPFWPK
jgi:hypothetical protein